MPNCAWQHPDAVLATLLGPATFLQGKTKNRLRLIWETELIVLLLLVF